MSKDIAKAFGRFDNGFTLTFENGLVLSTRFGAMNYCENRAEGWETLSKKLIAEVDNTRMFSDNAEVAVWLNNSESKTFWVNGWQLAVFDDAGLSDDVRGWVSMAEWLQIVDWCRAWKPKKRSKKSI